MVILQGGRSAKERREVAAQLASVQDDEDLEKMLGGYRHYYNAHRVHTSLGGNTPAEICGESIIRRADHNQPGGNLIAVCYISCPLQPDQQFARHRKKLTLLDMRTPIGQMTDSMNAQGIQNVFID